MFCNTNIVYRYNMYCNWNQSNYFHTLIDKRYGDLFIYLEFRWTTLVTAMRTGFNFGILWQTNTGIKPLDPFSCTPEMKET